MSNKRQKNVGCGLQHCTKSPRRILSPTRQFCKPICKYTVGKFRMKAACIVLTIFILIAIMAVCVMVKFATDITVEERKREFMLGETVFQYPKTKSMGVISLVDNSSLRIAERFPYVAAVTRNSSDVWSFACFASIVLVKWMVTSAHCRGYSQTHRVLLFNDFARNYTHTYPILFWRIHEKFNTSSQHRHDIAVAKLNGDFYPYDNMKPSVFDEREVSQLDASVWKTLATMDKRIFLTNDLAKYEVQITNPGKCFEGYGIELDQSLICIDVSDHDDCFIHEFGPLYAGDKVVGVLTVKPKDCDMKLAIFTNVSFYTNWILKATHTAYYG